MFIAFVMSHQLYPFSQPKKNQVGRFMFPRHLKSVKCTMPGNEPFTFPEEGFMQLGENSQNSEIPQAYYQSLIEKRIIDCDYSAIFPEEPWGEKNFSFRQALLLDFTQKKVPNDTYMQVSCVYNEPKPIVGVDVPDKDYNMITFAIQECDLVRERGTGKYSIKIL
jgi:hypothetical protein